MTKEDEPSPLDELLCEIRFDDKVAFHTASLKKAEQAAEAARLELSNLDAGIVDAHDVDAIVEHIRLLSATLGVEIGALQLAVPSLSLGQPGPMLPPLIVRLRQRRSELLARLKESRTNQDPEPFERAYRNAVKALDDERKKTGGE